MAAITLTTETGDLATEVDFLVRETLSVPCILGRIFVNTYVDAIRPGRTVGELQDSEGTKTGQTAIVRDLTLVGSPVRVAEVNSAYEPKVPRLAQRTRFKPLSDTVVTVNGDLAGLCQVQSTMRSYKRHKPIVANGIIDMPAWTPTLVVVANYRHKAVTLPKGAHLGTAKLFEGYILSSCEEDPVAPPEVLSVSDTPPREPPTSEHSELPSSMTDMPLKDQEALKAMAEADLDHLTPGM
eukprot:contig_9415_g2259